MLNQVILLGRLTKDPIVRKTGSGVSVASFTLAVDRDYQKEECDFINCTAWRNTADFVERNFSKGQMMAVRGSLQSSTWVDKGENSRESWEVVVDSVWFGGDKKKSDNAETPYTGKPSRVDASTFEDLPDDSSELPF